MRFWKQISWNLQKKVLRLICKLAVIFFWRNFWLDFIVRSVFYFSYFYPCFKRLGIDGMIIFPTWIYRMLIFSDVILVTARNGIIVSLYKLSRIFNSNSNDTVHCKKKKKRLWFFESTVYSPRWRRFFRCSLTECSIASATNFFFFNSITSYTERDTYNENHIENAIEITLYHKKKTDKSLNIWLFIFFFLHIISYRHTI